MSKKAIFEEIVKNRQSIYPNQFTGAVIPQADVEWILKQAIDAPAHRQTNPWRFRVMTRPKFEAMTTFLQETYKSSTPAEKFKPRKVKGIAQKFEKTSHFIIITMQRDEQESVPEWEEVAAVSCAMQNLYLAATALEYGGYWSSPAFGVEKIGEFLDLNKGERCLGFFYLGVPDASLLGTKADKGDLSEKVTWL